MTSKKRYGGPSAGAISSANKRLARADKRTQKAMDNLKMTVGKGASGRGAVRHHGGFKFGGVLAGLGGWLWALAFLQALVDSWPDD